MKRALNDRRRVRPRRRGATALEVALTLAVTFPIAMVCFWLARLATAATYQVISVLAGSPLG